MPSINVRFLWNIKTLTIIIRSWPNSYTPEIPGVVFGVATIALWVGSVVWQECQRQHHGQLPLVCRWKVHALSSIRKIPHLHSSTDHYLWDGPLSLWMFYEINRKSSSDRWMCVSWFIKRIIVPSKHWFIKTFIPTCRKSKQFPTKWEFLWLTVYGHMNKRQIAFSLTVINLT